MIEALEALNVIQPGEVVYVYADEKLRRLDQQGKRIIKIKEHWV
jgi:hypothetical protein